jgi:hypothetical protein
VLPPLLLPRSSPARHHHHNGKYPGSSAESRDRRRLALPCACLHGLGMGWEKRTCECRRDERDHGVELGRTKVDQQAKAERGVVVHVLVGRAAAHAVREGFCDTHTHPPHTIDFRPRHTATHRGARRPLSSRNCKYSLHPSINRPQPLPKQPNRSVQPYAPSLAAAAVVSSR